MAAQRLIVDFTNLPAYDSQMVGKHVKGHYECPRCNSSDLFESTETTGAMALTVNTPGPVDPTLISPITNRVLVCRNCGEKARWIDNPLFIAEKLAKEEKVMPWITGIFALLFAGFGIYALNQPWLLESSSGGLLLVVSLVLTGIFALATFSMAKGKRR